MNKHKHVLASGWARENRIFRECTNCRQVFEWKRKQATQVKSDYTYYKQMAEYYAIR